MGRPTDPTSRDRAQLIIVTGLAIGVTLVALVVILNTVIYTENLATRSAGVGGGKAVEFRGTVVEATGAAVDHENREDYETWTKARRNVTHAVDRVDFLLRLQYAEAETAAEVTEVTTDEGLLLRQTDGSRNFSSSANASTWNPASDVDGNDLRQFDVVVEQSELSGATPATGFNVTVDDGSTEWRLSVYTGGSDVRLAVHNGSQPGTSTLVCGSPRSGPRLRIDLTAGTVNGTECDALQFGKGVSGEYSLDFVRGDAAGGTYNLTTNSTGDDAGVLVANFDAGPQPYRVPAVYSLRLDVHYEQPRLVYHDRVRVAPGEPR